LSGSSTRRSKMKRWVFIAIVLVAGFALALITDSSPNKWEILKGPFFWLVLLGIAGVCGLIWAAFYLGGMALGWTIGKNIVLTAPTQAEARLVASYLVKHPSSLTDPTPTSSSDHQPAIRAHLTQVTALLAGALALSTAVAAITERLIPQSLAHSLSARAIIVAVSLVICGQIALRLRYYRDLLLETRAINTMRAIMLGYATLVGFASAVAFAGQPLLSPALIFLAAAIAFGTASLYYNAFRRELPGWLPVGTADLIACWIVFFAGVAAAFLIGSAATPEGAEYLRYAIGLRSTVPDEGANEWVASFCVISFFALALVAYARAVRRVDSGLSADNGGLGALAIFPLVGWFFLAPAVMQYAPLVVSDWDRQREYGVLGAFAVYSRIAFPLAFAMCVLLFL
jgi:FtsH-binding integral membrane protein